PQGPHRNARYRDRRPRTGGEAGIIDRSMDRQAREDTPALILVVDDEESITQLVATALRYEGFTVETAESGRAALAATAARRPDLVILDVMLPDLDGFEIQRRLAASGDPVPVVYLTARDRTEDRVHGLTLGAD